MTPSPFIVLITWSLDLDPLISWPLGHWSVGGCCISRAKLEPTWTSAIDPLFSLPKTNTTMICKINDLTKEKRMLKIFYLLLSVFFCATKQGKFTPQVRMILRYLLDAKEKIDRSFYANNSLAKRQASRRSRHFGFGFPFVCNPSYSSPPFRAR